MGTTEERLAELERRIGVLESKLEISAGGDGTPSSIALSAVTVDRSIDLVKVKISQKRFDPSNPNAGTYEDHVWFDCEYVPAALAKATRAVKGLLEFSDHFGEVKFRIQVTVNEPLTPGRSLVQKAIGFTYNQFMEPHQWMLVTKEGDMKCTLRLTNVLYTDGSTEVLP